MSSRIASQSITSPCSFMRWERARRRRHGGIDDAREIARFDQVEGARRPIAQRALAFLFDVVQAQVRPPTTATQAVAGRVDGDLVEPGRKARFLLEGTQSAVGLEERLLAEVAG